MALSVSGSSAIIMDMDSGRVLYEKNADEPRLIASITKIMTAVLALESGKLNDIVTVGEEVLTMYGSNIYIELNEKMRLEDLVYGLLLRSGNDAAIVIATYIGGSEEEFVKMMNDKAKKIGMTNTVFNNSHGLDEVSQNRSSARDMAKLSSYANTLEEYRKISGTKKYALQGETKSYLWYNRNKLLETYKFATGGKTGYTPRAGRTLVTTATKDFLNLTAVTLNDPDEYTSHENMYEYAFNNYTNYKIIDKNNFYLDKAYFKDDIYINEDFSYPLTNSEKDNIKTIVKITKTKKYKNNDKVGEVVIKLKNKELKRLDVFVKTKKTKKGFLNFLKSLFS